MAKPKKRRKIIIFSVIGAGARRADRWWPSSRKSEPVITVQTEKVARHSLTNIVVANGKIQPVVQVTISPEVSGEIIELPVKEGQQVKKDDLLVKINPDIYIAAVNQAKAGYESSLAAKASAEANLEKAQADYDRNLELFNQKLLSESDFIGFKSARNVAKAQLDSANDQVNVAKAVVDSARGAAGQNHHCFAARRHHQQIELATRRARAGHRAKCRDRNHDHLGLEQDGGARGRRRNGRGGDRARPEGAAGSGRVQGPQVRRHGDRCRQFLEDSNRPAAFSSSSQSQEATKFEVRIRFNEKEAFRPGMSVSAEIETALSHQCAHRAAGQRHHPAAQAAGEKGQSGKNTAKSGNTNAASSARAKPPTPRRPPPAPTHRHQQSRVRQEIQGNGQTIEVVFVTGGDHVKMVPVKIGICDDDYWEITEGLTEGQEVVSGGYRAISKDLEDGKKIKRGTPDKGDIKEAK